MARPPMGLGRALAVLAMVVGGAAVSLRVLDALGRTLAAPANARRWASVAQLERWAGRRLATPSYFPRSRGTPSLVRTSGTDPVVAVLGYSAPEDTSPNLYLAQTLGERGDIPADALPAGAVLETRELQLGPGPARLRRVAGEDGFTWYALRWDRADQSIELWSRGPLEQLIGVAESLQREGP